ncbi:putative ring-cleaving dioxygenase MhqO [compost metagenome]
MFEIATDPPGFTVDEPEESLGEELMLPDWYESERSAIESMLPSFEIRSPE